MKTREQIVAEAELHPHDVILQINAAYACDREGHEEVAVRFYERAWSVGLPAETDAAGFLLGYGSTLKNVGRLEESEMVLRRAVDLAPENRALTLFLSLTLERLGKSSEALSLALSVVISLAEHADDIRPYVRALSEYAEDLTS